MPSNYKRAFVLTVFWVNTFAIQFVACSIYGQLNRQCCETHGIAMFSGDSKGWAMAPQIFGWPPVWPLQLCA